MEKRKITQAQFKRNKPPVDWDAARKEYIEAHPTSKPSRSELARRYDVSLPTLSERFKREDWEGKSAQYWRRVEQEKAQNELSKFLEHSGVNDAETGDKAALELAVQLVKQLNYNYIHAKVHADGDPVPTQEVQVISNTLKQLQGIIHAAKVPQEKGVKGKLLDAKAAAEKDVDALLSQLKGTGIKP